MDVDTYLCQEEYYFSESGGQLLKLEEMPFPHLFHAYHKLLRELEGFKGSMLFFRMLEILCPPADEIRRQLREHGTCAYMHAGGTYAGGKRTVKRARDKLYSAARPLGKKVTTHRRNGWVVAEMHVPNISVRGVESGG